MIRQTFLCKTTRFLFLFTFILFMLIFAACAPLETPKQISEQIPASMNKTDTSTNALTNTLTNTTILPESERLCSSDADCAENEICLNTECAQVVEVEQEDKLFCESDIDCVCGGMDKETNSCFVGNVEYYRSEKVDKDEYCPDFCSGIAGNKQTRCVNQQCKITQRTDENKGTGNEGTGNLRLTVKRNDLPATSLAQFEAELYGVGENDEAFYCAPLMWDYGNGETEEHQPICPQYGPKSKVEKIFKIERIYPTSGVFFAQLTVGNAVSNKVAIAVREGDGTSLRCSMPNPAKGNCDIQFTDAFYYDKDTDTCVSASGCEITKPIPFSDRISCQLTCQGGYAFNNCATDKDCVIDGYAGQWCMAKEVSFPALAVDGSWMQEYRCYEESGSNCACINNRCIWDAEAEICLSQFQ